MRSPSPKALAAVAKQGSYDFLWASEQKGVGVDEKLVGPMVAAAVGTPDVGNVIQLEVGDRKSELRTARYEERTRSSSASFRRFSRPRKV